jgi:hypothetical protein
VTSPKPPMMNLARSFEHNHTTRAHSQNGIIPLAAYGRTCTYEYSYSYVLVELYDADTSQLRIGPFF